MQRSVSTTTTSALSQVTKMGEKITMKHTQSTNTKLSMISQITNHLKKASSELNQKLEQLRSRADKSKAVGHQKCDKGSPVHTPPSVAVQEPTMEDKVTIDVETVNKDDVRKARRDVRRAKWAARRASLKQIVQKAGKFFALCGVVVLGLIFGPVIIILDLIVGLVAIVIRLVVELLGLICAPFYVCFLRSR